MIDLAPERVRERNVVEQNEKCRIGIVDLMSFFWTLAGARKKGEDAFGLALQVLRYMRDRLEKANLDAIAFCADGPGPSWRTSIDAGYKAHREDKPADRVEELAALMAAMRGAGMCVMEEQQPVKLDEAVRIGRVWFEGDDLCASVAKLALEGGDIPVVYSNDGDLSQLLAMPGVELYSTRGEAITPERVFREWGVMPARLGDLKALAGDVGDGYKPFPGSLIGAQKGIGEKGAADLIKAYGSAQAAMNKALSGEGSNAVPERLMNLLRAGGDAALDKGLKLALLRTDAPVPEGIAEVRSEDWDAAEEALKAREKGQRDAARLEDERAAERDLRAEAEIAKEKAAEAPIKIAPIKIAPIAIGRVDPALIESELTDAMREGQASRVQFLIEDVVPARGSIEVVDDGAEEPILLTAAEYWALAVLPAAMAWLAVPDEAFGRLNALSFALGGLFKPVAGGSAFLCAKASKAAQEGVDLLAECATDIASGAAAAADGWREQLIAQIKRIPGSLRELRSYGKPLRRDA